MGKYFESGLLAGVTASVIWMSISFAVGGLEPRAIGLWSLVFLVIGLVGTMVISSAVGRSKQASRVGG